MNNWCIKGSKEFQTFLKQNPDLIKGSFLWHGDGELFYYLDCSGSLKYTGKKGLNGYIEVNLEQLKSILIKNTVYELW